MESPIIYSSVALFFLSLNNVIATIHSIPFTTPIPTPAPKFLLIHNFKSKESEDNDLCRMHDHIQ